jgi:hypothetical protein
MCAPQFVAGAFQDGSECIALFGMHKREFERLGSNG